MFKKISIIILGVLLLISCNKNDDSIEFVEDVEFDFDMNFDYCSLVDRVDGYKVKAFERFDNEIKIKNFDTVYCNTERIKGKTGDLNIKFSYKDKEYIKTIKVIKTKEPYFDEVQRVFSIDRSNNEEISAFEELVKTIKAYDYNDNEITVEMLNKLDITKLGEQTIILKATDKDNRISELELLIKLHDSDVPKEVIPNPPSESGGSTPPATGGGGSTQPPTEPPPITPPPAPTKPSGTQFFSIDDYADFDQALGACQSYISGANGACNPVRNDEGVYIGYQGEIY